MTNLSKTTITLMKYSKSVDGDFSYKHVKEQLIPLYHERMKYQDVIRVLLESIEEIMNEPKFELNYGKQFIKLLILKPLNHDFFIPDEEKDIYYVYDKMIESIMYGFMFTNIGWLEPELKNQIRGDIK